MLTLLDAPVESHARMRSPQSPMTFITTHLKKWIWRQFLAEISAAVRCSAPVPEVAHSYAVRSSGRLFVGVLHLHVGQVIALDFFHQFDSTNLLGGDTSMRYRHVVPEPGGSMSATIW